MAVKKSYAFDTFRDIIDTLQNLEVCTKYNFGDNINTLIQKCEESPIIKNGFRNRP